MRYLFPFCPMLRRGSFFKLKIQKRKRLLKKRRQGPLRVPAQLNKSASLGIVAQLAGKG
jgi:hypothetical protein